MTDIGDDERTKGEKQRHSTDQGICLPGTATGETATHSKRPTTNN